MELEDLPSSSNSALECFWPSFKHITQFMSYLKMALGAAAVCVLGVACRKEPLQTFNHESKEITLSGIRTPSPSRHVKDPSKGLSKTKQQGVQKMHELSRAKFHNNYKDGYGKGPNGEKIITKHYRQTFQMGAAMSSITKEAFKRSKEITYVQTDAPNATVVTRETAFEGDFFYYHKRSLKGSQLSGIEYFTIGKISDFLTIAQRTALETAEKLLDAIDRYVNYKELGDKELQTSNHWGQFGMQDLGTSNGTLYNGGTHVIQDADVN